MKTTLKTLAAAGLTLALALPLLAHDAWVNPGPGPVYDVLYGHITPENYPAAKVTSLQVLDAGHHFLPFERLESPTGLRIKPTGQPAMFALEFDNGYWSTKAGDKESSNVRLTAEAGRTKGSRLFKFSKTVLSWQPWMFEPVGQRYELVPKTFTGKLRAGQPFVVRLLLDGQPVAGGMVETNSNEKGPRTDRDGYVTVTLVPGINRLANDLDLKQSADPDATRLSLTTALVFMAE